MEALLEPEMDLCDWVATADSLVALRLAWPGRLSFSVATDDKKNFSIG
jgi:hypothetical protein